jgi:uncharacterized heparinase superfamily protein
LALPTGQTWIFDGGGLPLAIEDGIFFATPDGARQTKQIVISGGFDTIPVVSWRFSRKTNQG